VRNVAKTIKGSAMNNQNNQQIEPKKPLPVESYPTSCGDPILADSCCEVVSLTNLENYGRGLMYHAHLMDNGKVLVESPDGGPPYLAKQHEFVRIVECHHQV